MYCEIYNGGLMLKKSIYFIGIVTVFLLFSSYARAEVDGEVQYILNTFLFLVSGFLMTDLRQRIIIILNFVI